MNKRAILALVSLLFFSILNANEVKNDFTQIEKEYLQTKKSIKMCIDPSWMPYESFDENGNHIGMSADFFKIFQKNLGIEIIPVVTKTWSETLEVAKRKECDIFSLAMPTPERKVYMNFTTPYLSIPLVIVTRPNVTYINDIGQLKNNKIGILKGYAFNEIIRAKHPSLTIVDIENIDEGFVKVADGELFGFIGTLASIGYKFQTDFTGELKISGTFDSKWELGIGVRNDEKILLNIFQKIVNNLNNKQKQEILNRWLSIRVDNVTNYKYLNELILVFFVFVLVSLYWMRRVAKANKNIKESSDTFEYLFNNTIEGILLFQDNIAVDVNESGLKLFGTTDKNNLIGKTPFDFITLESIEIIKENMTHANTVPYEVNAKRFDGSTYPALIKGTMAVLNGKETRITGVIDLTELKEKERDLEIAKEKAEESTKQKSEFLANMSHEIRTPMNGILGMTYLALETKLEPKQQKFLNTINSSASSLLNIINDILDFSKIEAGKLEIDNVDFNLLDMVNSIKEIMILKAKEKDLVFEINYASNLEHNLHGDSLRISQVLINLLNNALKFTEKGFAKLEIQNRNNKFIFKVSDSGIGMSETQQENLFSAFNQADGTTTRKYGGTGLGLSISKQLVELMGGHIWSESKLGEGSLFCFELSLEKAKNIEEIQNVKQYTLQEVQTLKGSKILLVEDNIINQEIVLGLLENSGIIIDVANNGKEAVAMFDENHYELILMDLQMPIMDGYEATKIIRESNKEIPIIALTANAMKEDVARTKAVGMDEHLNKPIDVKKLYETLLKYIAKKIQTNEIETKRIMVDEIEIPTFKNINTKQALKHLAGNKKLYLKILRDFYTNYKSINLESLNEDEFKRVLHTMKGLSANIGAIALNAIIKELEQNNTKELQEEFYKELNKVMDELESLSQTEDENQEKKEPITQEKRDELFLKLKEAVATKRPKQCEPIIQELENYKLANEDETLFITIKELMKHYKFKEIISIMESLNK